MARIKGEGTNFTMDNTEAGQMIFKALKGNTEQKAYSGKNLYKTPEGKTIDGITYTLNADGTYNINGTATARADIYIEGDISDFIIGETYVLSANQYIPEGMIAHFEVYNGNTWVKHCLGANNFLRNDNQPCIGTFNSDGGDRVRFTLRVATGTTLDLKGLGIQLEKSSEATNFEPYVGGKAAPNPDYPQDIKVVTGEQNIKIYGKNLFDKNNANTMSAYFNKVTTKITSHVSNRLIYLSCEPNTSYVVSKLHTGGDTFFIGYTNEIPVVGTQVYGIKTNEIVFDDRESLTLTTGTEAKYIVARYYHTTADTGYTEQQLLDSVQIEKGSVATQYSAYQEQNYPLSLGNIELVEIGDYADYIEGKPDNWVIKQVIGKTVLNGTESWGRIWNGDDYGQFYFYKTDKENGRTNIICNKLITEYSISKASIAGAPSNTSIYVTIEKSITNNDVDTFKTWLSTNNMIVYYQLAMPNVIPITDTTLINQLNALYYANSYNDETNILTTYETGNMPIITEIFALYNKVNDNMNVLVDDDCFEDISNAIREKNETEETYRPGEMGNAIRALNIRSNITNAIIEQYKSQAETINADTFVEFVNTFGDDKTLSSRHYSGSKAVLIDENKIFLTYGDSDHCLNGIVCTINDSTIVPGIETIISSSYYSSNDTTLALIDTNKVFILHSGGSSGLNGIVCTINGTTITPGTDTSIASDSWYSGVAKIDTNKVFVAHGYDSGGSQDYYLTGIVCTINGTTITPRTDTVISYNTRSSLQTSVVQLDTDKVFIAHSNGSTTNSTYLNGVVCRISGTAITPSTDVTLVGLSGASDSASAVKVNENKVFIAHNSDENIACLNGIVCTIDETTITPGADTVLDDSRLSYYYTSTVLIDTNKVFVTHDGGSTAGYGNLLGVICNIQGTKITPDSNEIICADNGSSSTALISTNKVFISYHAGGSSSENYLNGMVCNIKNAVKQSYTKIEGLTRTQCTPSVAGDIYILNTNN